MIPQHYHVETENTTEASIQVIRDPNAVKISLRHLITSSIRTFVDLMAPADRMRWGRCYQSLCRSLT
jgi:hypothetical protein